MKILRIFLIAELLFVVGCALTKQAPPPSAPDFQRQMTIIRIDIQRHYFKAATWRLEHLLAQNPQVRGSDDAYILLGDLYYRAGHYTKSYRAFISVLNWKYLSTRDADAEIGAARALYKLSRYDEALNFTKTLLRQSGVPPPILYEANYLQFNIQWQLGDHLDALRSLVYLAENSKNPELREQYHIRAMDIADSGLTEAQIRTIANDPSFGFVQVPALYHVGVEDFKSHDLEDAQNAFENIINDAPNSDLAQSAQNYIQQINAQQTVAPFTIGAVLPITNKNEMIHQSALRTLRGLELGLGIFNRDPSDFKLAVVDSRDNPDMAKRAVEKLVVKDHAIAIVGDILSHTALAVAQEGQELGVPVISLSQKLNVTNVGNDVFQNALTGTALVKKLVKTAMDKYGMRRFAILYPNDGYGVKYANLFWDEVAARGGVIAGAQIYPQDETNFSGSVSRLLGTFYLEARENEYIARLKKWYKKREALSTQPRIPNDILPPITDFDAIFIPDDVVSLGQITARLVASNVGKNVWLLGTNLWNTPGLITRGTAMVNQTLFVDSTGVSESSFTRTPFYLRYEKIFGEAPTIFEAQAYDTGRILKKLIDGGVRTRPDLRDALARIQHFHGLVGDISVDSDREFSRPLTVLTVSNGQIVPANGPSNSSN